MNITAFAQYAGVSKAAVSRYFNGGYLSAEKRAQIAAAVEATGYRPSMQAQMLRTRRTRQIGVIMPRLSSESCARMVEVISRVQDLYRAAAFVSFYKVPTCPQDFLSAGGFCFFFGRFPAQLAVLRRGLADFFFEHSAEVQRVVIPNDLRYLFYVIVRMFQQTLCIDHAQ